MYKYLGAVFLLLLLLIILNFPKIKQGFQTISNLGDLNIGAPFSKCQNVALLNKVYPVIHKNKVSNKKNNTARIRLINTPAERIESC